MKGKTRSTTLSTKRTLKIKSPEKRQVRILVHRYLLADIDGDSPILAYILSCKLVINDWNLLK